MMKVLEKDTKKKFNIVHIKADMMTLEDPKTKTTVEVKYNKFKKDYDLVNEKDIPTVEEEMEKAKEAAKMVKKKAEKKLAEKKEVKVSAPEEQKATKKGKKEVTKENIAPKKEEPKKDKKEHVTITTLQDICKSLGIDPAKARKKLRGSDIAKPEGGWEWPTANDKDIRKVIQLLGGK